MIITDIQISKQSSSSGGQLTNCKVAWDYGGVWVSRQEMTCFAPDTPPLSAHHFATKYLDDIDQHKYLCGYISLYSNFLTILIFPVLIRILIFWNILIILKFPANGNGSLSSGAGNNTNREVRKYKFISGVKYQHSENIFYILGGISTPKQYISYMGGNLNT